MYRRFPLVVAGVMLAGCADSASGPVLDPPCSTPLALRRGEVRALSGADAVSCVVVASSGEASEYLFVTANAAPTQDDLRAYRVSAASGTGALASFAPRDLAPAFVRAAGAEDPTQQAGDGPDFRIAFEDRLRRTEHAMLGGRSLSAIASANGGAVNAGARVSVPPFPRVGDTLSYRVGDATSSSMCTNFTNVRAVVKAMGDRALVVQDVTAPVGGFTDDDFAAIATEFDAVIYPVDAQWFGTPTDINADWHVTILYTPAINKLTPTGSLGFAGGFFFSGDLLPRSVPSQGYSCPASNEQEIVYLLAPDPNGVVNGNRYSRTTAMRSGRGTTAHELQHLINQGMRQASPAGSTLEVTWLNEGLSHFAEEAVGRAVRGYTDFRRLTFNNVLVDLDDYDAFFKQNLSRFRYWMQRPDLASPISGLAGSQLAPRGAAWGLVRYAIDQFAGTDARAFTRALVAGPQVGVANLEARARLSFDQILPGFLIASFADTTVTGLDSRFKYASWAMRDAMAGINGGVFPLQLTPLPVETSTQSLSGSGNYFMLARPAGAEPATFRMLSTSGGAVGFADARVYLLRTK